MAVESTALGTTALTRLDLRAYGYNLMAVNRGDSLTLFTFGSVAVQGLAEDLWASTLTLCAVVAAPELDLIESFYDVASGEPAPETMIIPAGVSELRFGVWGASGGAGKGYAYANTILSGGAAYVSGIVAVMEGDEVTVEVGRGGGGAYIAGGRLRRGLGGWPDGRNGKFYESHGCYGGGTGGSSRVYLNGTLIASAAGSLGTSGYPAGIVCQPATETYLHPAVMEPFEEPGQGHVPGGVGNLVLDYRPGWGVLNTGPDTDTRRDGTDGLVYLSYERP